MLPRELGRFERRSLVSSEAIICIALGAIAIVVLNGVFGGDDAAFLASVYSFGVLVAFSLAQAGGRSACAGPSPTCPGRSGADPTSGSAARPCRSLRSSGIPLTLAIFVLAMVTHPGARYAGPIWLLVGLGVFWAHALVERPGRARRRRSACRAADGRRLSPDPRPDEARGDRGGDGRDRDRARRGARDRGRGDHGGARARAGSRSRAPLPPDVQAAGRRRPRGGAAARERERRRGAAPTSSGSRSIEHAIVDEAKARGADLIVLGSAPRWRRQSRFFSPTVDYVLRNAPCEVLVVAFPDGVLEE